ncbi:MAG: DUF4149 domain-containing protein [Candidatus Macondimonas sp.]
MTTRWGSPDSHLLALWLGAQLAVGYGVAPLLFARLPDPVLAGALAGELFRFIFLSGIPVLLLALWKMPTVTSRWPRFFLYAAMASVTLQALALQPLMAHFKSLGSDARISFLVVHGASQILYAGISLMLLAVVFAPRRPG